MSAAVGAVAMLAVAGCGGSAPPTPSSETTTTSATSVPTSFEPSPAPSLSTATASPTSTPAGSTTSPRSDAPTPSAGATRWPKALGEPAQGDPVWAVYLALGHSSAEPALDTALRQAASVGYTGVQGDVACDKGASEALGLDQYDYWTAVTLYFATEKDARGFVASYQAQVAKVAGVVHVNVGCLD